MTSHQTSLWEERPASHSASPDSGGGLADPRGNLALVYLAMADRYRPEWLVWENVPGVLSSNGGRDFGAFLGGLAELGYGFAYRVLDAQYFGVAQRRRRVFVVANLVDWRRAAAVLFEPHSLSGHPAPRRETREGVAGTIGARTGISSGADDAANGHMIPTWPAEVACTLNAAFGSKQGLEDQHALGGGSCSYLPPVSLCLNAGAMGRLDAESETLIPTFGGGFDVARTLRSQAQSSHREDSETYVVHTLRGEGFDASEDGTGRGTPLTPVELYQVNCDCGHEFIGALSQSCPSCGSIQSGHTNPPALAFDTTHITSASNGSNPKPGDPCHTLTAGAHPPAIAFDCKASGQAGFGVGDIASTMRAMGHANSHQNGGGHQAVAVGMSVRRLTPVECERLQDFPDGYTAIPWRGKPADQCPDGPRYKALGNSMAVCVMSWIGERIAAVAAQSEVREAA